jgi:hypothetical protein
MVVEFSSWIVIDERNIKRYCSRQERSKLYSTHYNLKVAFKLRNDKLQKYKWLIEAISKHALGVMINDVVMR